MVLKRQPSLLLLSQGQQDLLQFIERDIEKKTLPITELTLLSYRDLYTTNYQRIMVLLATGKTTLPVLRFTKVITATR